VNKLNFPKKDVFVNSLPNKRDLTYIVSFFILLSIFFLFNFIQSNSIKSWGNIYLPIFIITLILLIIGYISKNKSFAEVIFGSDVTQKKVLTDILVGGAIGFVLIYSLLLGSSSGFLSFFRAPLPFSVGVSSTGNVGSLVLLVVLGILAVEAEESFRASALVPTFTKLKLPIVLLLMGIITIVIGLAYVSLIFFIFAFVLLASKDISARIDNTPFQKHAVAILLAAVIFGFLHIYAYGNSADPYALMGTAMLFAIVADSVNWLMQSTIASRITHSVNNSFIGASELGANFGLAALVVVVYALIIVAVYQSKFGGAKGAINGA